MLLNYLFCDLVFIFGWRFLPLPLALAMDYIPDYIAGDEK